MQNLKLFDAVLYAAIVYIIYIIYTDDKPKIPKVKKVKKIFDVQGVASKLENFASF